VNARTRQLLEEVLDLSAEDRALIAAEIEASLEDEDLSPEEVAKAWAAELQRRLDDVVAGRVETRDMGEVLHELRARYER
jgi:putative addiction module component (TIGR02574 family)